MSGLAEILEENARLRRNLEQTQATLMRVNADLGSATRSCEETQAHLRETVRELELTRAQRDAAVAEAERLAQRLELLRLEAAGPTSRRFVPTDGAGEAKQETLPFSVDLEPPPRAPSVTPPSDAEETEVPAPRPSKGGSQSGTAAPRRRTRQDLAHLPATEVRCTVGDARCVGCGGRLEVFGETRSFRVTWVRGHFRVDDIVREKCSCPRCPGQGVLTAPGPYLLDRCLAGNGLAIRVACDKFCDHIPANRQANRMRREGLDVGSHTVSSWIGKLAEALDPVAKAIQAEILEGEAIQGDDTGMPVQDGGEGTLRKGRMWAFTDQEQVFYAFTDSKCGAAPQALLADFKGRLLVVDGGSEFNPVVESRALVRGGCWSHLRTTFHKALPYHPKEAALALGTVRDLFLIEREIGGATPEQVRAARQARSRPLVDGFYRWLKAMGPIVRPKSVLADAVAYALNQEAHMRQFLDHGEIPMHNNLSELMLRQLVVGRKNWLFARSEGGAKAAATFYTLIGSCHLQGIDPETWLNDVATRLLDHPVNRIRELTPKNWAAARQLHKVP